MYLGIQRSIVSFSVLILNMDDGKKIAPVKDYGAFLRLKKGMIVCELKDKELWQVSPAELSSIVILSTSAISSEVVKL